VEKYDVFSGKFRYGYRICLGGDEMLQEVTVTIGGVPIGDSMEKAIEIGY
jgi:hypothetical protein